MIPVLRALKKFTTSRHEYSVPVSVAREEYKGKQIDMKKTNSITKSNNTTSTIQEKGRTFQEHFGGKTFLEVREHHDKILRGYPFARGFGLKASKLQKQQIKLKSIYDVIQQTQRSSKLQEKKSPERGLKAIEKGSSKKGIIKMRQLSVDPRKLGGGFQ